LSHGGHILQVCISLLIWETELAQVSTNHAESDKPEGPTEVMTAGGRQTPVQNKPGVESCFRRPVCGSCGEEHSRYGFAAP
jgi:hypothetical protein